MVMPAEYISKQFLPCAFAAYMAMSARLMNS